MTKNINHQIKMYDLGNRKNSVRLKSIAVRLRVTALHVWPPGVETPGYYLSFLRGLKVLYGRM